MLDYVLQCCSAYGSVCATLPAAIPSLPKGGEQVEPQRSAACVRVGGFKTDAILVCDHR